MNPIHTAVINRLLTPSLEGVAYAQRIALAFEAAQARGEGRVEVLGSQVERLIYRNAKRILERDLELRKFHGGTKS